MRHPLRGLLIGPMFVPLAYWVGVMVFVQSGDSHFSAWKALRELAVIVAFGLPIAYVAAFAWGAPVLYVLHRLGWLRPATVIGAGAMGGAIVALGLAFDMQGSLIRLHMSLPGGALLGALAGGACWWAGQGKAGQDAASP